MARLGQSLINLKANLRKAKARILIVGIMSLMVLVLFVGTIAVLRYSYVPVARQYQGTVQRTLQRVAAEFESLDGKIAFANVNEQISDGYGIPLAKLPLEFFNVIPGHIEEIKPLRACSFSTVAVPDNQLCAGVLENRAYGTLVYLRGKFQINGTLTSPIYAKSPFTAHHFSIAITAKGNTSYFLATFDPVRRANVPEKGIFSPAWSIAGFKTQVEGAGRFTREPDIKGRVLAHGASLTEAGAYEFILQVPLYAYSEGANVTSSTWPPEDISKARVILKLVGPDGDGPGQVLMDGSTMNPKAIFSFESMGQYLAPGESLKFFPPGHDLPVEVFANGSSSVRDGNRSALSKLASIIVELVTPAVSTQKAIQLSNGGKIELQGNPALVLGGWSAAAKAIIAFAFIFGVILVLSGFAIYYFVVAPLNHVRRNTIYMRGRYSDAEDFKLPHTISNRHDEIGVLWVSIEDLHRSITTYGREALEHAKKESDLLRAIGHEIKSPLQDLLLRHNNVDDPSAKSLKRISYALKTLSNTYSGQSSEKVVGPKEAISSSRGNITKEDVSEYLENAAESSDGIITFNKSPSVLYVSADGDMLEASLMAVLNNAKEFRKADTNIVLQIFSDSNWVLIHISNQGPHIPFYPIEEVFEYGVSSRDVAGDHQGLGLFIAKQYITKMGGDIAVKNVKDGVRFEIKLARAH